MRLQFLFAKLISLFHPPSFFRHCFSAFLQMFFPILRLSLSHHIVVLLSTPPTAHLYLTPLPLTPSSEWLCLMLYHDWWRGESALSVRREPGGAGAGGGSGGGEARHTFGLQERPPWSWCWPRRRPRWARGGRGGGGYEEESDWSWRWSGMESWGAGGPGTGAGRWTKIGSSH